MATYRVHKNTDYTTINNKFLKRKDLSWKAKGILSYLLSLPDDWELHFNKLKKNATDGKTSTRSGLDELKDNGYLVYTKTRNEEGKFVHNYDIYEIPQDISPDTEKQDMDNRDTEKRDLLLSTNKQNTNKQNTNNNSSSNSCEQQEVAHDSQPKKNKEKYPTLAKLERTEGGHRQYPKDFEDLYSIYPKRQGSNAKGGAYKKFRARMKEGIPYKKLFEGVKTYMVEQKNKNNIGTEYIMQMKKFLGPQDIWLEYAEKDLTKDGSNGKDKVSKGNGRKEKTTQEQKEEWREDFANFSG